MNEQGLYTYAVTIKESRTNDTQVSEIDARISGFLHKLRHKGVIMLGEVSYERDSRAKLHAHFTVRCRSFRFGSTTVEGWRIHVLRLKAYHDLAKWENYLKKERLNYAVLQMDEELKYYREFNGFLNHMEEEKPCRVQAVA